MMIFLILSSYEIIYKNVAKQRKSSKIVWEFYEYFVTDGTKPSNINKSKLLVFIVPEENYDDISHFIIKSVSANTLTN